MKLAGPATGIVYSLGKQEKLEAMKVGMRK
jgi:hypothetical protein